MPRSPRSATARISTSRAGGPRRRRVGATPLRILLRYHGAPLAKQQGGEPSSFAALELVLAEAALEPQGGHLSHESLANGEQVVRIDLPAASANEGAQ